MCHSPPAICKGQDVVCLFQVMQLMSDKEDSLVFEEAADAVVEEVSAYLHLALPSQYL